MDHKRGMKDRTIVHEDEGSRYYGSRKKGGAQRGAAGPRGASDQRTQEKGHEEGKRRSYEVVFDSSANESHSGARAAQNSIGSKEEGAYQSDATSQTAAAGFRGGLPLRARHGDGSTTQKTNDSLQQIYNAVHSEKMAAVSSGVPTGMQSASGFHQKMNQTVSEMAQTQLMNSSEAPCSPNSPTASKPGRTDSRNDLMSTGPPARGLDPTSVQFSKESDLAKQESAKPNREDDQDKSTDNDREEPAPKIRFNHLIPSAEQEQLIESSLVSTQAAGPFVAKAHYHHRNSSKSNTMKTSPRRDFKLGSADEPVEVQQPEPFKNAGKVWAGRGRQKVKNRQRSNNSQGKQGSGGKRGETSLHRSSLDRPSSECDDQQPKKYICTGGQKLFFSGGLPTDQAKGATLATRHQYKQQQQKPMPAHASDYESGSQSTLVIKSFTGGRIVTDQDQRRFIKVQNAALQRNPTYSNLPDSQPSITSPNTSIEHRTEHMYNRFKKKDHSRSQGKSSKEAQGRSYKVPQIAQATSLHERYATTADRVIGPNSKSAMDNHHYGSYSHKRGQIRRQAGSQSALEKSNSSRYNMDPGGNHYQTDAPNFLSQQALPIVSHETMPRSSHHHSGSLSTNAPRSFQQPEPKDTSNFKSISSKEIPGLEAKNRTRQPLLLNKQSQDITGHTTFLSAITSSHGIGEHDGNESLQGLDGRGENAAEMQQKQVSFHGLQSQNQRYLARQSNDGLLRVQRQILGNLGRGGSEHPVPATLARSKGNLLLSQEKIGENGNGFANAGIQTFVFAPVDPKDSRRQAVPTGLVLATGWQTSGANNEADHPLVQIYRREDPYRDNSASRNPQLALQQRQHLLSKSILQSKSRTIERQKQALNNSMDHSLMLGGRQDESQKAVHKVGDFVSLDAADSRLPFFKARSQHHRYEEQTSQPYQISQSQSYQTLQTSKDKDDSRMAASRQSLPNPILKSTKLPRIDRSQGNEAVVRASHVMDDSYQTISVHNVRNEPLKLNPQVKFKRSQQMTIPKTLSKGSDKRTATDSDFMLYYKSVKMEQKMFGENLEGLSQRATLQGGQQATEQVAGEDNDFLANLEIANNSEKEQEDAQLPNHELKARDENQQPQIARQASTAHEGQDDEEQNSQKSTEKMNTVKSESQDKAGEERETERRGSAAEVSNISEQALIQNDKHRRSTIKYSMTSSPNRTTYPIANAARTTHQDSRNALTDLLAAEARAQNSMKPEQSAMIKTDIMLDQKPKSTSNQMIDFDEYQMATASNFIEKQPSLLDTPPMSFSINQQPSNRSKTIKATTHPLAVFEIPPKDDTQKQTETSQKKAFVRIHSQLEVDDSPYQNSHNDIISNSEDVRMLLDNKRQSEKNSKIDGEQLAPEDKMHKVANQTEAAQMMRSAKKREHLLNLRELSPGKLPLSAQPPHGAGRNDGPKTMPEKKERPVQRALRRQLAENQSAELTSQLNKKEDNSEQHHEVITVYDESQGHVGPEMNNATESNYPYTGSIQHEQAHDSNATSLETGHQLIKQSIPEQPPAPLADEQEDQLSKPVIASAPLAPTVRSTHTTSTTYIVDQLQKIKLEWDILERAQQNIKTEKEQIASHMKSLQRHQDKLEQKREIQEQRMKLEQRREQIGLEMQHLEQLKVQMQQMKEAMEAGGGALESHGAAAASRSQPQLRQEARGLADVRKEGNRGPSFGKGSEGQEGLEIKQYYYGSATGGEQPMQQKDRPLFTRNQLRHHHSTQQIIGKIKTIGGENKHEKKNKKAKDSAEPVNDYNDESALKPAAPQSKLNNSSSSQEFFEYGQEIDEAEEGEEFTFNELELHYDKMSKMGTKTVGGHLGKDSSIVEESSRQEDDEAADQDDQGSVQQLGDASQGEISHLSLNVNYLTGMKVPGGSGLMFDWAESNLMQEVLVNRYKFMVIDEKTGLPSERIFHEGQVLQMLKLVIQDPSELSKQLNVKKVFKISLQTLAELMSVLGQQANFPSMLNKYQDMSVENTVRLLVRCRQCILTRRLVFQTLRHIVKFQKTAARIKFEIDLYLQESEDGGKADTDTHQSQLFSRLKQRSEVLLPMLARSTLANIETLRTKHKLFENMQAVTHKGNQVSNVMCYKKVDAEKLVKKEYKFVMKITKAIGIQMVALKEE